MAYLLVNDFEGGQDVRKSEFTAPPGTLRRLINGHISRGGEVEKRKSFEKVFTLPPGTSGLHSTAGQLVVYGVVDRPAGMPPTVVYYKIALTADPTEVIDRVLSVDNFGGVAYAVVRFNHGRIGHFYGDALVTSWNEIATTVGSRDALAAALVAEINNKSSVYEALNEPDTSAEARLTVIGPPGEAFTTAVAEIDDTTWDMQVSTIQAAIAPVAEVAASTTFDITGGTLTPGQNRIVSVEVNGVDALGIPVDWTVSSENTAKKVAERINQFGSAPDYTATATGVTVTIKAPPGTAANGFTTAITTGGTVTTSAAAPLAGGVDMDEGAPQLDRIRIVQLGTGTQQPFAYYRITLNAANAGTYPQEVFEASLYQTAVATFIKTVADQMYGAAQRVLRFTGFDLSGGPVGVSDPTKWNTADANVVNAGLIDMSTQDGSNDEVVAVGTYQNRIAVFSRRYVQIWSVGPLPEDKQLIQILNNIGTVSPRTVASFGDQDVFFLSESGVRSLRARDSSNLASAADVGNPIDPELVDFVLTQTKEDVQSAVAVVEPTDGRYWVAVGTRMYVFSFFQGSSVSAWSTYELPGRIDDIVLSEGRVWFRIGNAVYRYGGRDNRQYDDAEVEVRTPFMDAGNPAQHKDWSGLDIGCEGAWRAFIATDPEQPEVEEEIGVFGGPSFSQMRVVMVGRGSHISLRLRSVGGGYHKLTNMAIHYDGDETG